jgi:hypothetical protein
MQTTIERPVVGSVDEERLEVRMLPVSDLAVDRKYQRILDKNWCNKTAQRWRPELAQALEVSVRQSESYGEQFFVIDGQHRLEAAKIRGIPALPCIIHRDLASQDEATLFVQLQKNRRPLGSIDLFWAMFHSNDPSAVRIAEICEKHGFIIARKLGDNANNKIACVSALQRVYRYGEGTLEETLSVLRDTWDGQHDSLLRNVVQGLGRFIQAFALHENYAHGALVDKLKATSVTSLAAIGEGRARDFKLSAPNGFARAVLEQYNHRRQHRKLPPSFLIADDAAA